MSTFWSDQNNFHTLPEGGIEEPGNIIPLHRVEIGITNVKVYSYIPLDGTYRMNLYDVDGELLERTDALALTAELEEEQLWEFNSLTPNTPYRYRVEGCDEGEFAPT